MDVVYFVGLLIVLCGVVWLFIQLTWLGRREDTEHVKVMGLEGTVLDELERVDGMDGHEFERYLVKLYIDLGYEAINMPGSGDQGVDLIVRDGDRKIGVQAKRYKSKLSNKAVQEVYTGVKYHGLDEGVVVTNSDFTKSGRAVGRKTGIKLVGRKGLIKMVERRNRVMSRGD